MRSSLARHCAVLFSLTVLPAFALADTELFSDRFDSEVVGTPGNEVLTPGPVGSTGWNFVLTDNFQSDVRYGYDYSSITATDGTLTIDIPEAPNTQPGDAAQTGAALRTNFSAGARSQAGIYYEDASFTGRYRVQVDMFLSWAADADRIGTTEHGGLFIGSDTLDNPANTDYPASTGAGTLLSTDGDTSQFDHLILKNDVYPSTASGQYSVTDFGDGTQLGYSNVDINTDPSQGDLIDLPALFPEIDLGNGITQDAGAAGFRWVTLIADVDTEALGNGTGTETGLTTFSVEIAESGETYTIGTLDNSIIEDIPDGPLLGFDQETEQGPVDMSGRVTLTLIDFFTTTASDTSLATVIFDNLIVTQIDQPLEGDYNADGIVNAADYAVYRDTEGDSVTPGEGADGNGNGVIDAGDYTVWESNYGASATATAVPEPAAAVLALLAAGSLASRRRHN